MNIINCTYEVINIYDWNSPNSLLHVFGKPSACVYVKWRTDAYKVGKFRFKEEIPLEVVNLPEPQPDTFYIVTEDVKRALPHRKDLIRPAKPKLDKNGNIEGYYTFIKH